MRRITPLVCIVLFACSVLFGEGTHELAPNASITIGANTTTDLAALHINNPTYNSFASYSNPDPKSRLYIHVRNPQTECLFVGFSFAHPNSNVPNPPQMAFEFRIKDPNGNIVFGPMTVNPAEVNIHNWLEGFTGPSQLHGPAGYDAFQISSSNLASQGWTGIGDYYIEFQDEAGGDMLIDFWDITVADCSGPMPVEKKGRVWSYNWSIFAVNDFGFPNRPFNGAFYVCAPDPDNVNASFVTKIDFNDSGFRPAAFNIAINSFGAQHSGNVDVDRKSVRNQNATQSEYAIFLNDPVEICQTATVGNIELLGVSRCDEDSYCIKFITSKEGQVDILFDFDGQDNIYTPGTADLKISQHVDSAQVNVPTCIPWDGRDGLGNLIAQIPGTQIPVTIAYAQGIYHFPIYDAEFMTRGVIVQAVRPAAPNPLIYYDDTNIGVPSGTGEPVVQLSGCVAPCHGWTNYTQPDVIGFGNLNTINSWWFSQLIIRQDVFFLPAYYTCAIEGPTHFCHGGSAELSFDPTVIPSGAEAPHLISIIWDGPGIVGFAEGNSITVNKPGTYVADFNWTTAVGDTCSSTCSFDIAEDPAIESSIDTLILLGDEVVINGETFDHGGTFHQVFTSVSGCDSILTINVVILNTVVHYDLDDCYSNTGDGSSMDYTEFVPAYPEPLSCANLTGGTLHRELPLENKHSCTPGVNGSVAMCVSSLNSCTYVPGSSQAIVFTLTVNPSQDTAVHVTGLSFYGQGPANYNWINGGNGPNNYPTLYGLRVLKNGSEILRREGIPTTLTWHFESFDFSDFIDFIVDEPATFTFELLPYCLVGNGAAVAAWDIDEVSIQAGCVSPGALNPLVAGVVRTPAGQPLHRAEIRIAHDQTFNDYDHTFTHENGEYAFEKVKRKSDYFVRADKNDDYLNGVSTLDLILIQKHLLGITPFITPYQFIAADANHSNSLSAIDLLELRKLILGLYDSLPRNHSWRFINAKQEIDISSPWSLQEMIGIEYLTRDIPDLDFTAVKIGDINGDVSTDLQAGEIASRGSSTVNLQYQDVWLKAGQVVEVPFYANHFEEISGFQFALGDTDLRVVDYESGMLVINKDQYLLAADGSWRISYDVIRPVSLVDGQKLFGLTFISAHDGYLSEMLKLSHSLHAEAYVGAQLTTLPITLSGTSGKEDINHEEKLSVYPNPFSDEATIEINLEKAEEVQLIFYNLSGQVLVSHKMSGIKGQNKWKITGVELGMANGMILCKAQSSTWTETTRVMLVK